MSVNHVAVLVLGDIGRSPRMQYHCLSLATLPNTRVSLIGYRGERCVPSLEANSNIHKYYVPQPFASVSRKYFLLYAPIKVLLQHLVVASRHHSSTESCVGPKPSKYPSVGLCLARGTLLVYSIEKRKVQQTVPAHDGCVVCSALSVSGTSLLTGGADGAVKLWSLGGELGAFVSDVPQRSFKPAGGAIVTAIGMDSAGEFAVAGFSNGHVEVFDLLAGTSVASITELEAEVTVGDVLAGGASGVTGASVTTVGSEPIAVIACVDGRVSLFTAHGAFVSCVWTNEVIRSMVCDPSGRGLLTVGSSGLLKFWDLTLLRAGVGVTESVVLGEDAVQVPGLSRYQRTITPGIHHRDCECYMGSLLDTSARDHVDSRYSVIPAVGIAPMDAADADLMFSGPLEGWGVSLQAIRATQPNGSPTLTKIIVGYRGGGVRVWCR